MQRRSPRTRSAVSAGSAGQRLAGSLIAVLALVAALVVPMAQPVEARELAAPCPAEPTTPFTDAEPWRTHGSAIGCLYALRITEGISASAFGYDASLRHGQLASFVARTLDSTDVWLPQAIQAWFQGDSVHAGAIDRLYEVGIVDLDGYDPEANVTRSEMAVTVANALVFAGVMERSTDEVVFDDLGELEPQVADAVNRIGAAGITYGYGDGRFGPAATLTRAQMATFLANVLAFIDNGGQPLLPPPPPPPAPDPTPPARTSPEGWAIAGGDGPVAGTGGTTVRYTVEIADGLESRQELAAFADRVERLLSDPDHGWTSRGARRLQRVEDPSRARIRILLASPSRVDRLCGQVGLNTAGIYSCWNGRFAALNSTRWFSGVSHIADLELYRDYLVNHEVGHGLGYGHVGCPGAGRLAPVMVQQSMASRLGSCRPNGLPYP
jgi:hypothetical protein